MLLRKNQTGEKAVYTTEFEYKIENNKIIMKYIAHNSLYYCPYSKYNEKHYLGDVCELFIGKRNDYYELQVNPNNNIFFKRVYFNLQTEERNSPAIPEEEYNKYVKTSVTKFENGYIVDVEMDKSLFDYDDILFNAYRIETDGGETEKYLFALNPTMCGSFHKPQYFIELK